MVKLRLIILPLLVLSACSLGPDPEKPPPAPVEDTRGFINALYGEGETEEISRWWERINDPLLNNYVDRLLVQNLDIKQAGERVLQARERLNTASGSFYPTLGLDADASRSFSPAASDNPLFSGRQYSTSYSTELSSSWQIDLFGKLRRSAQSAEAGFRATQFERQALIHSLIAELMKTRVAIASQKQLRALAEKSTANRQQVKSIIERRYNLGTGGISADDVLLARENHSTVEADIYRYERQLAAQLYNLDVLLGLLPGTTDPLAQDFALPAPPVDVPVCLPADLIDRRPDLRASALRTMAAKADIGVAVSDLYPALNLAGSLGFTGDDRTNIFTAEQMAGSLIGSITTRLFEGGKLRANIRLQESEARELASAYAQDVLNAVREVETALKNEKELQRELAALTRSTKSLKDAEAISESRYKRGILDLREYLQTQQRRYAAEQAHIAAQQERWNNRIDLYLALGGDWLSGTRGADDKTNVQPLPCDNDPVRVQSDIAMLKIKEPSYER